MERIGQGAYGRVYADSRMVDDGMPRMERIAIKRNFKPSNVDFAVSIRELDIQVALGSHPCISRLLDVRYRERDSTSGTTPGGGHPRARSPPPEGCRDDAFDFVYELSAFDLHTLIYERRIGVDYPRCLAQLLLGLEYIHSQGILHRDIKPSNILVHPEYEEVSPTTGLGRPVTRESRRRTIYNFRICDFGISSRPLAQIPGTPQVATEYFRAPEVILGGRYGSGIDIWALGCTFHEMLTRKRLIDLRHEVHDGIEECSEEFSPAELAQALLTSLPYEVTDEEIRAVASPYYPLTVVQVATGSGNDYEIVRPTRRRIPLETHPDEALVRVITRMLTWDPARRPTATQLLEDPYFVHHQDYIRSVRRSHPPVRTSLPSDVRMTGTVRDSLSRWIWYVYERRATLSWYKPRVLFHTVELIDRYLVEAARTGHLHLLEHNGKFTLFLIALHLATKYFMTIGERLNFHQFCRSLSFDDYSDHYSQLESFEVYLLEDVWRRSIYRETPYEVADARGIPLDEVNVQALLQRYLFE